MEIMYYWVNFIGHSSGTVEAKDAESASLLAKEITGKEVSILVNGFYQKGKYSLTFNGSNLASGVYFYKMTATGEAGEFTDTKKLELIK